MPRNKKNATKGSTGNITTLARLRAQVENNNALEAARVAASTRRESESPEDYGPPVPISASEAREMLRVERAEKAARVKKAAEEEAAQQEKPVPKPTILSNDSDVGPTNDTDDHPQPNDAGAESPLNHATPQATTKSSKAKSGQSTWDWGEINRKVRGMNTLEELQRRHNEMDSDFAGLEPWLHTPEQIERNRKAILSGTYVPAETPLPEDIQDEPTSGAEDVPEGLTSAAEDILNAEPTYVPLSDLLKGGDKHVPGFTYKQYINKPTMKLLVLMYPDRDPSQPYNDSTGQKPLEMRIKPKCGLIEVDIPVNVASNFDKEKGVQYGEAMRKSKVLQEGGSYGVAGGLGNRGKAPVTADDQTHSEGPSHETLLENFDDANNKGHVMNKMTLAGQIIPFRNGDPIYFIGVCRGDEIHYNKVDAMVQLRPQLGHLDALADLEKSTPRAPRDAEAPAEETEARAVNMTVKSADTEELDTSHIKKLLKAMRDEPWQHLEWIDQEDPRAYETYYDQMFLKDAQNAPKLYSTMTDLQWLDALSAPRIDPTKPDKKPIMTYPKDILDSGSSDADDDSDNAIPKPRKKQFLTNISGSEDSDEWQNDCDSDEEEDVEDTSDTDDEKKFADADSADENSDDQDEDRAEDGEVKDSIRAEDAYLQEDADEAEADNKLPPGMRLPRKEVERWVEVAAKRVVLWGNGSEEEQELMKTIPRRPILSFMLPGNRGNAYYEHRLEALYRVKQRDELRRAGFTGKMIWDKSKQAQADSSGGDQDQATPSGDKKDSDKQDQGGSSGDMNDQVGPSGGKQDQASASAGKGNKTSSSGDK